jgi:glycosyltransferase involved in cell wall biosynthesis
MKILVVQTSLLYDGSEYFIHVATKQFIEKLNSQGHEVQISGSIIYDSSPVSNMESINSKFVCGFQKHFNGILSIASYCLSFLKSFKYISKYDFIYLFMPGNYPRILGISSMLMRKKTGIYLRVGNSAFTTINKILYKRSNFGFATGKGLNEELSKYVKSEEVIPLLNFPKEPVLAYNYKASCNVIFIGRVSLEKGVDSLLLAFQNQEIKKRDIQLHLIGDGDCALKTLADGLENVTFHGVVGDRSHLFDMLNSADIFCLPSLSEGFPRVLYEASFSRCALLTTFVGSIGSMLKDDYNCMKLDEGNAMSIVNRITDLYDNPGLLHKFQERAFDFYQKKFEDLEGDHADQVLEALIHA